MIVGKKNTIAWFESLNVPYWSLFPKGKVDAGNPVAKGSAKDSITPGEATEELRDALALQDRGQFTLIASEKPTVAARGGLRTDFEIPSDDYPARPGYGISGMPSSLAELDQATAARVEEAKKGIMLEMKLERMQEKLEELQKENNELEKEAGKGSNKFWEAINGIGLDKILGAFMRPAAAPAVTGIPAAEAPPENDQVYAARLGHVIEVFQEHDPDWLDTLERMASKIEQDPSIIKMFKKFL